MWNGIKLDSDNDIHVSGVDTCFYCIADHDYPHKHECGGLLHAEYRYDMEAGFQSKYIITRCDKCDATNTLSAGTEKVA